MEVNKFVEQVYIEFVAEQEAKELESIQNDYVKLLEQFDALASYANMEELLESITNEDTMDLASLKDQVGALKDIFSAVNDMTPKKTEYIGPVPDMTMKPKVSDNIRMFLTSIITWIKNILVRLLEFIKKNFASLFGLGYKAPEEKASLDISEIMKKEREAYAIERSYSSFAPGVKGNPIGHIDLTNAKNRHVLNISDDEFKNIVFDQINVSESEKLLEAETETPHVPTIYLDPSRDLFALREALNHFFKLFDESIGSNGEKLFETADIEILFNNFAAVKKQLEFGDTSAYADLGGKLSRLDIVSPDRLRDNLIRTKINIDNLMKAYEDTNNIISNILQGIAAKNYQGAVLYPSTYKLLSSATYKQMVEILKVVNKRIATAKVLNKNLTKYQTKFTQLTQELEQLRGQYMQLGSNYYAPSILQKEISNLFLAAKYVTQTIMLRFTALSLYTKVLEETKGAMRNLNLLNKKK